MCLCVVHSLRRQQRQLVSWAAYEKRWRQRDSGRGTSARRLSACSKRRCGVALVLRSISAETVAYTLEHRQAGRPW